MDTNQISAGSGSSRRNAKHLDYNQNLCKSAFTGLDKLFDGALVLDVGAGTRLNSF